MKIRFNEFLLESAPRLPNDVNYWLKKGKSGKNVCLIIHDDLDGVVSGIIMKDYLQEHGFKIKQIGIINYQEGWGGFMIDSSLITIALDFADDIVLPDGSGPIDFYCDHHGKFSEETTVTQKRPSIKTSTGSAAEGIAQQLGVPFSNDTKDWIDMIDSAKYTDYDIDIRGILNFDLSGITHSKNAKLTFAAAFNQLLKRSDDRTFIEVVNASKGVSIYNIFRLFKLFYPKNNPNWKSGDEPEFVSDARVRLKTMQSKTTGRRTPAEQGREDQGFDEQGNKIRYMDQKDFWNDFAKQLPDVKLDADGYPINDGSPASYKWQLKPGVYQLIGNLMYVPSGTWANALRAKAIFSQDMDEGIVPDDPKLNFVLLQYGNTLQIADLREKVKDMSDEDLPKDKKGNPINNLGKYCEDLVKNFETYLDYQDERTVSGGHIGIGTVSNIFGKCKKKGYEGVKFLDMFKNKMINDISGVKWGLTMPWNEEEEKRPGVKAEDINKKLLDIEDVRSEEAAETEKDEREIVNYLIVNDLGNFKQKLAYSAKLKDPTMKKIYDIWQATHFDAIVNGEIAPKDLESVYFKADRKRPIEETTIFNEIVERFSLTDIYEVPPTDKAKKQRKELKRIFKIMFNMVAEDPSYIKKDTGDKVKQWMKL